MTSPVDARVTRRSPLPLPPGVLLGLIGALLAIGLMALVSYRALESRRQIGRQTTQTLEALEQISRVLSSVKDAETGQRGFLLTGAEPYLAPYEQARTELPTELSQLRALSDEDSDQQARVAVLDQLTHDKLAELQATIDLRRAGRNADALDEVRSDRGKAIMDQIRAVASDIEAASRDTLDVQQNAWDASVATTSRIVFGGSTVLALLILVAGVIMSGDFRAREAQSWVRAGQAALAERLQGEHRLEPLGEHALQFLTTYFGAHAGTVYVADSGVFRRMAVYGIAPEAAAREVRSGDGLIGQSVKARRAIRVSNAPAGYLEISSSVGKADATEILIAPALVDGVVHGVVELGFFRRVRPEEEELLGRASEMLGIAVRAAKDRTRLEELLEETTRQAEELQTQQEELRVNNEELEEQSRALKESQARLETQQSELEEINAQLEEQTQSLEQQKDDLAAAQLVLTQKSSDLQRANQYKSEFLANMSHELRTPLNSTLILAKLLADNRDGNLSAQQVKFAQTILSAGNDLLALINDILDLSRIEAGKVELAPQTVQIAAAVEGVMKGLQPQAQQKGLAFNAVIDPQTPATIDTDPQRTAQILKNLVANALKFTERGEVELRVSGTADGLINFAVRDTGIGIPADQQSIIFDAFRQADGSTHRKYGGTGLGLSISRDLAHLLGGTIAVQSEPGRGSIFTLTLPPVYAKVAADAIPPRQAAVVTPPSAPPAPMPPTAAPGTAPVPAPAPRTGIADDRDRLGPHGRRLLVVEDDVRFATILRDLSRELGFQSIVTHTATEGVEAAQTYKPAAILLDINLPDHSGLGVLDQLKRNPSTRHIPVHVVSVADYTKQALERGAVGYALKPVKREDLIEAFRRLEARLTPGLRRVLVVEDDERQRDSIRELLATDGVEILGVARAADALEALRTTSFDCLVMDLNLPDMSGYELLERISAQDDLQFPPVIVYTGRALTRAEEQQLARFSRSIIIKDARSPERLLDEVTLFLHQVESTLPADRQRMLKAARDRDTTIDGRRILVVEDDARNIFALSSVLEPKGASIEIARNGREALEALERDSAIDLVLMDIMMPEMDGLTAMREIRRRPEWKKLPIIALTAKAMRDDQEKCLAAGANDYIAKPLDVEKLLSLVRVWMPSQPR